MAEIESTVLAAWRAPHPAGRVWAAPDAYHRLLAHGVAAFHGLRLAAVDDTTDGEGRGRALAVRGGREAPGPAGATVAALVAALQEGQAVLRPAEDVAAQEGAPLRLATACEAPAVDVQMEGHEAVVTQGGCFQEACVGTGGGPGWPEGHAEAPSPGSRSDGSDGSWEVVTDEEAAGLPGEAAWGGERGRWAGARGALRFLPGFLP